MAYMRPIDDKCRCGKRATVEVIDRWNGSRGKFCRSCGDRKLKELLGYEKAETIQDGNGASR